MTTNLLRRVWNAQPTTQALRIVNKVLAAHQDPLSTRDLYRLVFENEPEKPVANEVPSESRKTMRGKQKQEPPRPPHPEHPIRSMRYVHLAHISGSEY
jgi:hypothetical protein